MKVKVVGVAPTSAVLGTDGVTVETWGTPLTVSPAGVSPAVLAVARHVMALIEDQVGVGVPVTVASLTGVTNRRWVTIVTWSTPGWERLQTTDNITGCYNEQVMENSTFGYCLCFIIMTLNDLQRRGDLWVQLFVTRVSGHTLQ